MMSLRLIIQSLGLIRERKNFLRSWAGSWAMTYYPDSQIDEYETHAYHEGEYEIVVS